MEMRYILLLIFVLSLTGCYRTAEELTEKGKILCKCAVNGNGLWWVNVNDDTVKCNGGAVFHDVSEMENIQECNK